MTRADRFAVQRNAAANDDSYSVYEDEALVFSEANGNALPVADRGDLLVTVTLSIEDGALQLADTSGLAFFSGDNKNEVILTGTTTAITAALDGLAYTGALDASGARTLSIAMREPVGGNLIVNGNAEQGPSDAASNFDPPLGWARVSGGISVATYAPGGAGELDFGDSQAAGRGEDYFHGGTNAAAAAVRQRINLSARADEIDAGALGASIEGWFGGYSQQPDTMMMTVSFLDASGRQIGSAVTIGGFDAADRDGATGLIRDGAVADIPAGTRFAEIVLKAEGQGGTIDAYADNLSLTLVNAQALAVPIEILPMPEWVHGTDGNDTINGSDEIDLIDGGAGNDRLYGYLGGDRLRGGSGNDRLSNNAGGTIFDGGEGDDEAAIRRSDFAGDYALDLGLDGGGIASDGSIFAGIEAILFWGGNGRNTIVGGTRSDTLHGGTGDDAFSGGEGDDYLTGGDGNDILDGGDGNDGLVGGLGVNRIDGGNGFDWAWIDMSRSNGLNILGHTSQGRETYILSDGTTVTNVEQMTYAGGSGSDRVTGGSADDWLGGGKGDDQLHGGAGRDQLHGGDGDDLLDGGEGADMLAGGAGNDIYVLDHANDHVSEQDGEGVDQVFSPFGFTLAGTAIENLTLSAAAVNGTGNALANILIGNVGDNALGGGGGDDRLFGGGGNDSLDGGSGNDRLDGGTGADLMSGGAGNDVYIVDDAWDHVADEDGGGRDRVESSVNFWLVNADFVENLTLTGSAAINGFGNDLGNILVGNAAANHLVGGLGADRMLGGAGDDRYYADQAGDRVIELAGEGHDTVVASVSYSIAGQHVETLELYGSGDLRLTGNNLANSLTGNNGSNVLNGAGGADVMTGWAGNDRYIVDQVGDSVTEQANGGADRVDSAVSWTLGDHVENLILTGNAAISGTGNDLANIIVGNNAGNLIDGRGGADRMEGKGGNDRYIVNDAGDRAMELAGGGLDIVDASVSYSLAGQYVETLRLTGSADIDASGNNQANSLHGNAGANAISAAGGDDKLYGGLGNDTLSGGGGADRFVFDSALDGTTNVDTILDFNVADDSIYIDRSVFSAVAAGTLSIGALVHGTAALDAADRILFDRASGNIFYDADGSGEGAAVLFASVAAVTLLTNADFIGF